MLVTRTNEVDNRLLIRTMRVQELIKQRVDTKDKRERAQLKKRIYDLKRGM